MKKKAFRLLSAIMVLCTLLSMATPILAFAADGSSDASAQAEVAEPTYIFRETFSGSSINTKGAEKQCTAANGFWASMDKGSTYTLEDGTLKYTSRVANDYLDLRFYYSGTKKDLAQDFVLSFWIRPTVDNFKMTTFTWREYADSSKDEKNGIFKIMDGNYQINGVSYPEAHLDKDRWSLVEIVYNYDENAVSETGDMGAVTSYTFMLNGKAIATADSTYKFHNIDRWRFMQYAYSTYEIDDLTISLGSESLINVPRTSAPEYVYREEFDKGYINVQNTPTAVTGANGFWGCMNDGSEYVIEDAAMRYTSKVSKDYIDLRFYLNTNKKDVTEDYTFSFWLKPEADNFGSQFAWRDYSSSFDATVLKISKGALVVGGTTYSDAVVPKDVWSFIEVVGHYDDKATAITGETGAITSYTVRLNGKDIATVNAPKAFHNVNNYRIFQYSTGAFSIDDLTVSYGIASSYALGRSQEPEKAESQILFKEDFEDEVNTSTAAADVIAANGFVADNGVGSTYVLENGTFRYTDRMFKDYMGIQLWHDGMDLNLSQDFVLSFKLNPKENHSFRLLWKDHTYKSYENTIRVRANRFGAVDDYNTSGKDNPDVVIEGNKWSMVELVFHYDESKSAITGELGAFTFCSIYLNGKYVQTVKMVNDFHVINDFKLFDNCPLEYAIDDLTIATGNGSLVSVSEWGGWEKKQYAFDVEAPTDYDYTFAILGDPQSLTAWNGAALTSMYDWIAANAKDKKMELVFGLGDITQYDSIEEWDRASLEFAKLNGIVPHFWVRGNHDGSENFNNYLYGNSAYTSQFDGVTGGFYAEGSAETFWKTYTFGADKWLFIGLDFGPTDAELAWAGEVIAAHPDHKTIIFTHAFLNGDGSIMNETDNGAATSYGEPGVNDGVDIWEKLGSKHVNITMIISGHIATDCIVTKHVEGDNGNIVTHLLINPQTIDHVLDAGVGQVAMLHFKEGNVTVTVETYSASMDDHFLMENQYAFNLDGTPTVEPPTVVFKEDFSSGSVNTSGSKADCIDADGLFVCLESGSTFTLENETLKYTSRANKDYVDIRFYYDETAQDLAQNFILSFWIKPDVDNFKMTTFTWREYADKNKQETGVFKIMDGYYVVGGTTYKNAKLAKDQWALVEIVYNYDETAVSVTGALGAVTSYTFLLNGVEIATADATYDFHNIDVWRIMQWAYSTYEIDDLTIALGTDSLINSISSKPSTKVEIEDEPEDDGVLEPGTIIFHEDFEDAINTDPSESAVVAANGFWACVANGSEYVINDGVLEYTKRIGKDYVDIRFYYEGTKQNLAQDFILSFKVKPQRSSLSMQFSWRDRDHAESDNGFAISSGRFKLNGVTNPDACIKANEWALIEIAFHFNKNATAVTGEKGAIDSYTVMLNGKPVQTVETKIDYNNIDHFRIFSSCNDECQMDDIIVAAGNESLNDGSFNGWEKQEYYFDKAPVTDYDYSFCIVGDTQKVVRHNPTKTAMIYDWIVNNAESKNIKFVFGLGDITDTDADKEWTVARDAIFKLNGIVPYSLIRGNHDGSEKINTYFYVDEYTSQFMGFFGEGSMENSWTLLDAGSDKYLLITFDFGPTDAELEWAANIIEAYPDRRVIITTHTYLDADGKLVDKYNSHAPSVYDETSNNGDDIWNELASQYENVFLILSGHIGCDQVVTTQVKGIHGNTVTQMLIDPQVIDGELGASGMVTMLYFTEGGVTVQVETYSTIKEQYFLAENQFAFTVDEWTSAEPAPEPCSHEYDNACDVDCNKCGEVREIEHAYNAVVTAPDCVNGGFTTFTCTVCGDSYVADATDALGHSYEAVVTAPTCMEGGYTTYTCAKCDDSYVADETAATGHKSFYSVVVTSATCTEEGYITITCRGCDSVFDSRYDEPAKQYLIDYPFFNLAVKPHTYEAVVTDPTCANGGYTTYTCTVCGDSYIADEIPATGAHIYDDEFDADCNECGAVREDVAIGGACGSTATWRYENGVLYIEGTGSMNAYSSKNMPWIEYKNEITTVIVAEGIRSIGKCSFYEYVNLTSVTLPSTLRTINAYAFYGCSGLSEIDFPASLTFIKHYAFRRSGLVSATFENDCGWYAGENKMAAAELSFAHGAALHLVKYGFKADWTRDTKAEPEVYNLIAMGYCGTNAWWTLDNEGTLSILGSGVVNNCTSKEAPWTAYKNEITKVVIGEGITKLGKSAFYEYANITEVVLPSTLTEIGHYAFYGCKGLTEVTIPASVTTIGSYVFRKSGVTNVIFEDTEGWTYKGNAIDVSDAANVAYLMNKVSYSNIWSK